MVSQYNSCIATMYRTDPYAFWHIASGANYCEIVDDGRCVTDGPGDYGPNEFCKVMALKPLILSATSFHVEAVHDFVQIDGLKYDNFGPKEIPMAKGAIWTWQSDDSQNRAGFTICAKKGSKTCTSTTRLYTIHSITCTSAWACVYVPVCAKEFVVCAHVFVRVRESFSLHRRFLCVCARACMCPLERKCDAQLPMLKDDIRIQYHIKNTSPSIVPVRGLFALTHLIGCSLVYLLTHAFVTPLTPSGCILIRLCAPTEANAAAVVAGVVLLILICFCIFLVVFCNHKRRRTVPTSTIGRTITPVAAPIAEYSNSGPTSRETGIRRTQPAPTIVRALTAVAVPIDGYSNSVPMSRETGICTAIAVSGEMSMPSMPSADFANMPVATAEPLHGYAGESGGLPVAVLPSQDESGELPVAALPVMGSDRRF